MALVGWNVRKDWDFRRLSAQASVGIPDYDPHIPDQVPKAGVWYSVPELLKAFLPATRVQGMPSRGGVFPQQTTR